MYYLMNKDQKIARFSVDMLRKRACNKRRSS